MPDTAGTATPMTPPPDAPGPFTRLFIGRDGLRAPWSVVLFAIILFAATVVIVGIPGLISAALHHGRREIEGILAETTPLGIVILEWPLAVVVLVTTFVMARIEHRSPWSY